MGEGGREGGEEREGGWVGREGETRVLRFNVSSIAEGHLQTKMETDRQI